MRGTGRAPEPAAGAARDETCVTYMLRCSDGSLYTGWTNHLEERVRTHNAGRGARYTRSRLPAELVYAEYFATKEEAMSREAKIKRLTRREKLELVREYAAGAEHTS